MPSSPTSPPPPTSDTGAGDALASLFGALSFAADRHRAGRRRVAHPAAEPELNHLIRTAWWTHALGRERSPETLGAAVLHDVLERSFTRPDELDLHVPRARELVLALTDAYFDHEHARQRAQRLAAARLPPAGALIRAAAKLDNLLDHARRFAPESDPYAAWAFPVFEAAWGACHEVRDDQRDASALYEDARAAMSDGGAITAPPALLAPRPSLSGPLGLVLDATHFAAEYHRAQRRKSRADDESQRIPYINHPIRVAALLAVEGGVTDPVTLQAALLHDTIEDTAATPSHLRERFGDAVTAVVLAVTDDKSLAKAERKRLQIEHAPHLPLAAVLVKLADKIDNLRDLGVAPPDWPLDRIRGYFDWAEAVVSALPPVSPTLLRAFEGAMKTRP